MPSLRSVRYMTVASPANRVEGEPAHKREPRGQSREEGSEGEGAVLQPLLDAIAVEGDVPLSNG